MTAEGSNGNPPQGTPEAGGNGAAAPEGPPITINMQYVKDLSFEVPGAPKIFARLQQTQPNITVNVDVQADRLEGNHYEVTLQMSAECKVGDATAFIAEVLYGGLFTVNVPQEHLQPVLLIECPRLLFPYARAIMSDVTRDGGFPPLMVGPMDFAALYQQRMQQMAAREAPTAEA